MLPGSSSIQVLAANLTLLPTWINKGQTFAFLHFVPANEIQSFAEFGTLAEFGIDKPMTVNLIEPNISTELTQEQERRSSF